MAQGVKESAVPYKVRGAAYHLQMMRDTFDEGLLTYEGIAKLERKSRTIERHKENRLFWHFEAFLFQLYSAFDLVLQVLNEKRRLGLALNKVNWSSISRLLLDDPAVIHLRAVRSEDWFKRLTEDRHEIAHRRLLFFEIVVSEGKIYGIAPAGGGNLFDMCEQWLANARDALREALRLMKDTD